MNLEPFSALTGSRRSVRRRPAGSMKIAFCLSASAIAVVLTASHCCAPRVVGPVPQAGVTELLRSS
jgi:hypothetical protein